MVTAARLLQPPWPVVIVVLPGVITGVMTFAREKLPLASAITVET